MGAIRIDGFDAYQVRGGSLTSTALAGTGYALYASGGSRAIVTADGVTAASMAFQFSRDTSFYANMNYSFESSADQVVVGFALQASARGAVLAVNNSLKVNWPASGELALNGVTGPNTIVLRRWYYLELVINKPSGQATLYVNDKEFVAIVLPQDLSSATEWSLTFGWLETGEAGTQRIDDLVILDSNDRGDGITARLGPVENLTSLPLAAAINEFDNDTGATAVEVVSAIPPTEGRFIESSKSGARELFTNDQFADGRDVLAVTVQNLMSKTDLDDRTMGLQLETEAGVQELVVELNLDFQYYQMSRAADAAGAPWTAASINASQWGAVIRP